MGAEAAGGGRDLRPGRTDGRALFGLREGDNPHRWYNPADVEAVASAITADLSGSIHGTPRTSAASSPRSRPRSRAIPPADRKIRARYAGTPVGASESIFALQAPALGLDLITPYSFMKAISEGPR